MLTDINCLSSVSTIHEFVILMTSSGQAFGPVYFLLAIAKVILPSEVSVGSWGLSAITAAM